MPLTFDDCLKGGLLKRIPASEEKALRSLKKAKLWLKEAEETFKIGAFSSSILTSYLVMFHASRSILFFDGYREKSHSCIARYLESTHVKNKKLEIEWIHLLDHHRQQRHDDQYDISFISTDEEAKESIQVAKKFLSRMQKLFETISKDK